MIDNTDAFKTLKKEQQKILDFFLLVTSAVPSLKKMIKGHEEGIPNYESVASNDFFRQAFSVNRLTSISQQYKENLSRYLLLSSFAFFENYFISAIKELIEFHGGKDRLLKKIISANRNRIEKFNNEGSVRNDRKLLCVPYKGRHKKKYEKIISRLSDNTDYLESMKLIDGYGLKLIVEQIDSGNVKAATIPDLMEYALCLDMTQRIGNHTNNINKNVKEMLDAIRNARNDIAHGERHSSFGIELVMDYNAFLREIAIQIDNRLIQVFFVIF